MTLLFLCMVFFCFWVSPQAQNLGCHQIDLSSLRNFSVQLDPQSAFSDWDFVSGNCCNWSGINCNNSSRVARLELGNRGLIGIISESLGNMEQLVVLNLSHNLLHGPISNTIFHFPNLEVLDLSSNLLNGSFPSTMNMPSLRIFSVSVNRIWGPVPVGICINSSNISVLDLTDNRFSSVYPEVGHCTSLKELRIASNSITGELPENLFLLHNLEDLFLQENRFSGQLSNSIGNLSKLVHLDLSMNNFYGHLPDVFDRFEQLEYFSAQSNHLTGRMPDSLVNSQTITSLALRNNSLSGTININCSAMVRLTSLNLATNEFHGPIPETLSNCPQLRTINFGRINFAGQVPESFKNFPSLTSISLSNSSISNLTGALEIFQHCRNLTTLILTLNFKGENMPVSNSFRFPELRILVIANCGLHGSIPEWLSRCSYLQLLDLSWNRFSGSIPPWFGSMPSLFYLDLSSNSFVGEIPKELTEMQSLINDTISLEESSSDFPFFVRRNQTGFKYRQVISFPPTLSLGNNHLNGSIWPEFGNLKELHVLDLNHNNLSGPIPSNLSEMRSLETLDLSYNNLSGSIPSSLANLTFLSKFNVAHNFLSGPIPVGHQFSTFPNSSFVGNQGLCGDHGLLPCSVVSNDIPQVAAKLNRSKAIAMGVGIGLGSAIFISLICFVVVRSCNLKDTVPRDSGSDDADIEELSSVAILCQDKNSTSEMYFDELLKATNSFDQSNIIGCGGFGYVYKAILTDGRKVAIKRLSGEHFQMEREFHAEIETLSRAQHPNLVRLQGYCKYKESRLLIYTYMENGSLDYWLHEKPEGPSELHWKRRLEIAKGAARGLAYLHLCCEPHIIHRDIKSSNILLNERFEAHLADFGLARLILPFATHVSTDLVGTLGYIPPEYGLASVATYKGDVYSFGVVLLEILAGKRPMDICRPKGCRNLVEWAGGMKEEKRESEVFDSMAFEKRYVDEMMKVLDIAWVCLNDNPRLRPSIEELVSRLEQVDL